MNEQHWKSGDFSWVDLMTTDLEKAKKFYTEIFGWSYESIDTPQGPYIFSKISEGNIGGLTQRPQAQQENKTPSHWNTYIQVDSVDKSVEMAKELGGKIIMEPFDVMDAGRMAILSGPSGTTFSIWQSKSSENPPRTSGMAHGMFGWIELATNKLDEDGQFYCNLFKWKPETQDMPNGQKYTTFKSDATYPAAGMIEIQKEWGDMPSAWSIYFTTLNIDETLEKITSNEGKIVMDQFEVPKVGKMAVAQDPTGAHFCIAQWDFSENNSSC